MDNQLMWNGMGTWLIILLLFLGRGGNGFGFGNNNWAAAFMSNQTTNDLINNNTMWSNQLFNQQSVANLTAQMNMGFMNTNQNITVNTQKILDMMCNQETQRLRTELAEARVIAQNNQQTNDLIARLAPVPTPSYIVNSPYQSIYPPQSSTTNG